MTEHLPECHLFLEPLLSAQDWCICDALRACEQRVFALHPEWTMTGLCKPDCVACRRLTELITEWEYGYKKGLDDAREAVASMEISVVGNSAATVDQALAAIDALKEKR